MFIRVPLQKCAWTKARVTDLGRTSAIIGNESPTNIRGRCSCHAKSLRVMCILTANSIRVSKSPKVLLSHFSSLSTARSLVGSNSVDWDPYVASASVENCPAACSASASRRMQQSRGVSRIQSGPFELLRRRNWETFSPRCKKELVLSLVCWGSLKARTD
jgi:hypothetical protein